MKKIPPSKKAKTASRAPGSTGARPATRWHEAVIVNHHVLRSWPNVERVELGWKERGGTVTSRMAVKLYVSEKKAGVAAEETIPKTARVLVPVGRGVYKIRRVPTDVVWHAPAAFLASFVPPPGNFLNPVSGGASLAPPAHPAGTYTCLVVNQQNMTFAMTAGHVIQQFQGNITPGLQVLQPPTPPASMPPGATPLFGITAGGFFGNVPNIGFVDFALLDINPARLATSTPLDGGPVIPKVMPSAFVVNNKIPMTKFGAATGRTFAAFSAPVTSIVIAGVTVMNVLEFKGTPGPLVASGGDSGALAVSDEQGSQGVIIGLLFAATGPTPDAPTGRAFVMPFERLTGIRPL